MLKYKDWYDLFILGTKGGPDKKRNGISPKNYCEGEG